MAVGTVASIWRSATVYVSGVLGKHLYYMGILAVANGAVNAVVVALVCIVAGSTLSILCNIILIRR